MAKISRMCLLSGLSTAGPSAMSRITGNMRFRNTTGANKVSLAPVNLGPDPDDQVEEIRDERPPSRGDQRDDYRGQDRRRTRRSKYK